MIPLIAQLDQQQTRGEADDKADKDSFKVFILFFMAQNWPFKGWIKANIIVMVSRNRVQLLFDHLFAKDVSPTHDERDS